MAEFCYNNTISATTGITPFYANYGYYPRYQINPNPESKLPTPTILKEYANNLANLDDYLRSEISWSQAAQAEQADKYRLPAPKLEVGDDV